MFLVKVAKAVTLIGGGALGKTLAALVLLFLWQGSTHAMDVTIAWDANTEAELAGYQVYYDTDSGAPYSPDQNDYAAEYSLDGGQTWIEVAGAPPINVGPNVTMISLRGLSDNKGYFFAVKAFDSDAVESAYSREITVIAPSRINPPYNRGWGITSGDLKGFKVFYNTIADAGLTPTLGPSENIPSFDLPNLTSLGSPLNLQPSGILFNQPLWIEFPCTGYSYVNDLSLGLYDGSKWVLVWDGTRGRLTATGEEWLDGEPEYNTDQDPFTVTIVVRHFSGVQAAVPSPGGATVSGSGGGGGCFIGTIGEWKSSCMSKIKFLPQKR